MKLVISCLLGLMFVSWMPGRQIPEPTQTPQANPQPADGIQEFRAARYKQAAPLLKEQLAKEPDNALVAAHLLTSYVRLGRLGDADSLAAEIEQRFPNSADAISARGDLTFFRGDMHSAELLYLKAIHAQETTARAYYGLFRLYRAASMYRTARLRLMRAYAIDPDDRPIADGWFSILPPDKRREMSGRDRPLTGDEELARDYFTALAREINGRRLFEPVKPPEPAVVKLGLLGDPHRVRGVSVQVMLNETKPLHLELDTGATGILISERAAERIGLKMVGNSELSGLGDAGTKIMHGAVADICAIGSLVYKNCFIQAMEGKSVADQDGLFGADVLEDYIITIDFQRLELQLKPQPAREHNQIGYDRTISAEEKDFTPIFRFGHHLMVTTQVNERQTGLFLLDTGSDTTVIDNGFAREVTKTSITEHMVLKGLSGKEKEVFEAGTADLTFSHFRQRTTGMVAADLNHLDARPPPVRMAGIMGLPLLALFRLTLDYRNGLVYFDRAK